MIPLRCVFARRSLALYHAILYSSMIFQVANWAIVSVHLHNAKDSASESLDIADGAGKEPSNDCITSIPNLPHRNHPIRE